MATCAQIIRGVLRRVRRTFWLATEDRFLSECRGVIHVGANDGSERWVYDHYSLEVLWIEALPDVFRTLEHNLRDYPRQHAVCGLVTDTEGETYDFHVSNNRGQSSSIYDLHDHRQLWPEVAFTQTIQLHSTTLRTLVRDAGHAPAAFDALVLDVQGAELLVVKGAGDLLDSIRFIKAEAADFQAYQGACTLETLSDALSERGFRVRCKKRFAGKKGVGSCYDVLYERRG